jgi:hypothetical protein
MPRFVILEHDHPTLHWDLMLEVGDRLRTWRLAEAPAGEQVIAAAAIGDHRKLYLDYEGPVSGDRGTVRRWEFGTYEVDEDTADGLVLRMEGSRKAGTAVLRRAKGEAWQFRWSG